MKLTEHAINIARNTPNKGTSKRCECAWNSVMRIYVYSHRLCYSIGIHSLIDWINEWMNGWMNEVNEWMNGIEPNKALLGLLESKNGVNEWMDEWMNGKETLRFLLWLELSFCPMYVDRWSKGVVFAEFSFG